MASGLKPFRYSADLAMYSGLEVNSAEGTSPRKKETAKISDIVRNEKEIVKIKGEQ